MHQATELLLSWALCCPDAVIQDLCQAASARHCAIPSPGILATLLPGPAAHCCPTLQVRKLRLREAKWILQGQDKEMSPEPEIRPIGSQSRPTSPVRLQYPVVPRFARGLKPQFLPWGWTAGPRRHHSPAPTQPQPRHSQLRGFPDTLNQQRLYHNGSHKGPLVNSPCLVLRFFSREGGCGPRGTVGCPSPNDLCRSHIPATVHHFSLILFPFINGHSTGKC